MRILLIEDEHKIASSIAKGLEQETYAVDVCYDGTSGYDMAIGEEYDLIILDRMLPGMDGIAIVRKLREEKIHTPVLMLTAKGQLDDRVEGLNAGADDYLVKPFAFVELLARIKALSRRPKQAVSPELSIADLTLNTLNYEVKRAGKPIRLSSKEYALLEFLMHHQNTIITKDKIINHVWNYDADVLPNSVEVYIKHLRDKIDVPFDSPHLIHTIRGFGYKLSVEA
jgi:DNA-binding response OmpR family regulator